MRSFDKEVIYELEQKALTIRRHILVMITEAGSGHPGGSLSATDFCTALYFKVLKHNPSNPLWQDRDRVIFSKGHVSALIYSLLAETGYFPIEKLKTFRKLNSCLQGHPSCKHIPSLEISTGSLGQGLSVAVGIALGGRLDKKNYHVYCIMGDGEIQEGQVWEAAMSAAHHKLDSLCAIIDHNKLQLDGEIAKIKNITPLKDKWQAFNWHTIEIHGHNMEEILDAFEEAKSTKNKPTMIIAHTVKGKGVSFMENKAEWHGKALNKEELQKALEELKEKEN